MDVSQYLEIFVEETKEHLQSLSDNLLRLNLRFRTQGKNRKKKNRKIKTLLMKFSVLPIPLKEWQEQWDIRECRVLPIIWRMCFRKSVMIR